MVERYNIIEITRTEVFDYFWRSQRASQLGEEYEFDDDRLDDFFGWETREARARQARRYSRGALARTWAKMEINKKYTVKSIEEAMEAVEWK
jgi:hypothetical protein